MSDPRPIGVFDSGVGGLTVLREIAPAIARRNRRSTWATTAGRRTAPVRTQRSADSAANRSTAGRSRRQGNRRRCNTSTAVALPDLRRSYDLPILGVIRPGASAAALATRSRASVSLRTPATVRSHAYFFAIKEENPAVEVYEHATPALVPLVEAGDLTGPAAGRPSRGTGAAAGRARRAWRLHLPAARLGAIDTLLLGCTHYPLLRPLLQEAAGERVAIVDSGVGHGIGAGGAAVRQRPRSAAESAARRLRSGREVAPAGIRSSAVHVQYTTGDVDTFRALAARLFGSEFPDVQPVELRAGRLMTLAIRRPSTPSRGHARLGPWVPRRARPSAPSRPSSAGAPSRSPARASWIGRPPRHSRSARLRSAPGTLTPAAAARRGTRLCRGDGAGSFPR